MTLEQLIHAAMLRVGAGAGAMRIPADPTDPDIVLGACHAELARLRVALAKAVRRTAEQTAAARAEQDLLTGRLIDLAADLGAERKRTAELELRLGEYHREVERRDELLAASSPVAIAEQVNHGVAAERDRFAHEAAELRSTVGRLKDQLSAETKRAAQVGTTLKRLEEKRGLSRAERRIERGEARMSRKKGEWNVLVAEVARLKVLVRSGETARNGECAWCGAERASRTHNEPHRPQCPAFAAGGEFR